MKKGNVVYPAFVTKLDLPPDRILEKAVGQMSEVVICGFDKDGGFYFASSKADAGDVLYHLKMAKKKLLEMCDQ